MVMARPYFLAAVRRVYIHSVQELPKRGRLSAPAEDDVGGDCDEHA
jgi:hypothetical protein